MRIEMYIRALIITLIGIFYSSCARQDTPFRYQGIVRVYLDWKHYDIVKGNMFTDMTLEGISELDILKSYRDSISSCSINKAVNNINNRHNNNNITSFDKLYFTASPNGEYALQPYAITYRNAKNGMDSYIKIIDSISLKSRKVVYNLLTGDSIVFNTSRDNYDNRRIWSYEWSPDGRWLTTTSFTSSNDESITLLVNLSNKEITRYDLEEEIQRITWSPDSKKIAVLTREDLLLLDFKNLIRSWFHPSSVYSYYLYIIEIDSGVIEKYPIVKRIDIYTSGNLFWSNE